MTTIRERLTDWALGDQKRQLEHMTNLLFAAYQEGPFEAPPEQLLTKLMEYDSQMVQDMVMQLQWDNIGGYGLDDEGRQRDLSVKKSRRMWRYDPLFEHLIRLWTNYGFGESIGVTIEDEKAQKVWDAFWTSDANAAVLADDELQNLSNDVLIDGEFYFVYFIARQGGTVKVRVIPADEIAEIITSPDDSRQALFYKRAWTVNGKSQTAYYPDWLAALDDEKELNKANLPNGATRADKEKEQTIVVMQHVAHNKKAGSHGWPLLSTGTAWVSAHKRFREDRASVAAGMAMYIQKIKVDGGSRALAGVKGLLDSRFVTNRTSAVDTNPPAAPASTWLENEAATLEKLPMSTGAGDAQVDGNALLMMACLSAGVFPHYAGAGEAFRLATATAMESPIKRNWSRYQLFWSAQFRRMCRIVLVADEKFGSKREYKTYSCEVSIDRLIEVDLPAVTTTVSTLFKDVLAPGMESGMIPRSVVQGIAGFSLRMILQALGATDAAEIASDAALAMDDEASQEAIIALADLAERGEFTAEQVGRLFERMFGAVDLREEGDSKGG